MFCTPNLKWECEIYEQKTQYTEKTAAWGKSQCTQTLPDGSYIRTKQTAVEQQAHCAKRSQSVWPFWIQLKMYASQQILCDYLWSRSIYPITVVAFGQLLWVRLKIGHVQDTFVAFLTGLTHLEHCFDEDQVISQSSECYKQRNHQW